MVSYQGMVRRIACATNLTEELRDFTRKHAVALKAAQEFVLILLRGTRKPRLGSDQLRQQLGKLTQFQQRGIWVVAEVALRQHPQAQKLGIMLIQMGEVSLQDWVGCRHGLKIDHGEQAKRVT